jgi:hypothetical protein
LDFKTVLGGRATPRTRLASRLEDKAVRVRREQRWESDYRAQLRQNPSTVGRVLRRRRAPFLSWLDTTTGVVSRSQRASAERYECAAPGGLIHVDVKKLGKIPAGGGGKTHSRALGKTPAQKRARIGYDFVHSAIDDHTGLAYCEIHDDERDGTCAAFLHPALAFFASHAGPSSGP